MIQLGYCTNVHAGADLATTRANLQRHALAVKARFSPDQPMGIGLWLSAQAARKLLADRETSAFAAWLREVGLIPFTLNGFPFGDFHQKIVKHAVYQPTWWDQDRLDYTLDLIAILDTILPSGLVGSISTLPISWHAPTPAQMQSVVAQLRQVAAHLARLEADQGRHITLCLEPEPGCYLQHSIDIVRLFEEHLLPGGDASAIRRHLTVCHDVCHASVMFEDQADVLKRYHDAGLAVGKVQVSSALRVRLDDLAPSDRRAALEQLGSFAEDRYLHQTCVRVGDSAPRFFEDLPLALASQLSGEWRVHFHVPIYRAQFGLLGSSQAEISECLAAVRRYSQVEHFEVETYAWSVLPENLRPTELAAGIAEEMNWFREKLADS